MTTERLGGGADRTRKIAVGRPPAGRDPLEQCAEVRPGTGDVGRLRTDQLVSQRHQVITVHIDPPRGPTGTAIEIGCLLQDHAH